MTTYLIAHMYVSMYICMTGICSFVRSFVRSFAYSLICFGFHDPLVTFMERVPPPLHNPEITGGVGNYVSSGFPD